MPIKLNKQNYNLKTKEYDLNHEFPADCGAENLFNFLLINRFFDNAAGLDSIPNLGANVNLSETTIGDDSLSAEANLSLEDLGIGSEDIGVFIPNYLKPPLNIAKIEQTFIKLKIGWR